jgi:hypothetical protein
MLYRNIRIDDDLVDQLFNSREKRLAQKALLDYLASAVGDKTEIPMESELGRVSKKSRELRCVARLVTFRAD